VLKEKTAVQGRRDRRRGGDEPQRAAQFRRSAQIADAKAKGVLFSLHLKATMMKVSDPIMFGVVVEEFYKDVLAKHADVLAQAGFDPNNGIGDLYARLPSCPEALRSHRSRRQSAEYASVRNWRWSIPTRASPTCTCRAT
jgi:isocitrate dehydrogenase